MLRAAQLCRAYGQPPWWWDTLTRRQRAELLALDRVEGEQ